MDLNPNTPPSPQEMATDALTAEWWSVSQSLDAIKARELELRKELFARQFPNPVEGSAENKVQLGDGWILQADYKINRTVDDAVVSALMQGDNTRALAQKVFRYKPELNLKDFKALSPEERALISEAVTEKPGTPALSIKLPKR